MSTKVTTKQRSEISYPQNTNGKVRHYMNNKTPKSTKLTIMSASRTLATSLVAGMIAGSVAYIVGLAFVTVFLK